MSTNGLISHIELYVADLEQTAFFWGWLLEELGYNPFQHWENGISWKRDETYIVFVQAPDKYKSFTYHRRHPGLNHLAFSAASPQAVDDLTQKLRARDVPILYPERHPRAGGDKTYAVFFEDPNRIKVEYVFQPDTLSF